jgi:benzoyl-CoA reductase subunit C
MENRAMTKSLQKARDIYLNRSTYIEEQKLTGKKAFSCFCCYAPIELITAADILPVRILGKLDEPITDGGQHLPPTMCNQIRSCLDCKLKGHYDFQDGIVGCHGCDGVERVSQIWSNLSGKDDFSFFIDLPHTLHDSSFDYLKKQFHEFRSALEDYTGKKISDERIIHEINLHNETRSLVRELYELRKYQPPKISGVETLYLLVALMSISAEEGNKLVKEVIDEVKNRKNDSKQEKPRLLVWGSIIDNMEVIQLIEDSGANVVVDDTAVGTRSYWEDVKVTKDPIDGITGRYLKKIVCPRTFQEVKETYEDDCDNRFGYLKEFLQDWNVNGSILYLIRNCDIHGYEVPVMRDYISSCDVPSLVLEHDYTISSLAPLRTRLEAFVEMIR